MKRTLYVIGGTIVLVLLGLGVYKFNFTNDDIFVSDGTQINTHDATYRIEAQSVTLKNGLSEVPVAPGSASKITTRYFGNEVKHDFNGDGREDRAFIITQSTGGSGAFYYLVGALDTPNGFVGSDAVLLGDRIAPQTTGMGTGNIVIVNYAERAPGDPFTTQPSIGKSRWLLLDVKTMQWGEVAQNFEGEADPARMSLGMKKWNWMSTTYSDGKKVSPRNAQKFTLTFGADKRFSATTDCNGVGGEYMVTANKIAFDKMMSTLMYCEGSQEQEFSKMLSEVGTYHFTSKGELVFDLKMDSGVMIFK